MVMTATVGNGTVGLRERKKARTRDALRDAALRALPPRTASSRPPSRRSPTRARSRPAPSSATSRPRRTCCSSDADEPVRAAADDDRRAARRRRSAARRCSPASLAVADDYGAERARLVLRKRVFSSSPQLRASSAERQRGWEDAAVQLLAERAAATGARRVAVRAAPRRSPTGLAALRVARRRVARRRRHGRHRAARRGGVPPRRRTGSSSATRSSPSVRSSRTTPSRTCCRGRRRRWSGTRR